MSIDSLLTALRFIYRLYVLIVRLFYFPCVIYRCVSFSKLTFKQIYFNFNSRYIIHTTEKRRHETRRIKIKRAFLPCGKATPVSRTSACFVWSTAKVVRRQRWSLSTILFFKPSFALNHRAILDVPPANRPASVQCEFSWHASGRSPTCNSLVHSLYLRNWLLGVFIVVCGYFISSL